MIDPDRSTFPPQTAPRDDPPREETGPAHRRRWPWLLALGLVGAGVLWLVARGSRTTPTDTGRSAKAAGAAVAARAVPVVIATARKADLGIYLTGLGNVVPLNTVTVRSRVDGQLVGVAFREGQLVREGDLLAEIDPRPFQVQLEQAEGQKGKDVATLQNARLDQQRYEVLYQQDSVPRQQLDTQIATVKQLEAAVLSDQGQIDAAKLNLAYSRITAPVSGRVGRLLVDPGNIIHATDSNGLVVITQLQPISVVFTIPADRLPQVLAPLAAGRTLEVEAYDRDLTKKLATGQLLAVDNQIEQTTGTVRLKAKFSNADNVLFPNQFVNARLLVDTLKQTTLVPAAAIQRSPQSTFVYVVTPESTVATREVEVLHTEAENAAIGKGISAGDSVVIDGIDKLQPGSKVAVSVSGAANSPPAGAARAKEKAGRPSP